MIRMNRSDIRNNSVIFTLEKGQVYYHVTRNQIVVRVNILCVCIDTSVRRFNEIFDRYRLGRKLGIKAPRGDAGFFRGCQQTHPFWIWNPCLQACYTRWSARSTGEEITIDTTFCCSRAVSLDQLGGHSCLFRGPFQCSDKLTRMVYHDGHDWHKW